MLTISTFANVDAIGVIEGRNHEITLSVPTAEGGMEMRGTLWVDDERTFKPVVDQCYHVEAEFLPPRGKTTALLQNFSCFYQPVDEFGVNLYMDITQAPSARVTAAGVIAAKEDHVITLSWNSYTKSEGAHTRTAEFSAEHYISTRLKVCEKGKLMHLTGMISSSNAMSLEHFQLLPIQSASPDKLASKRKDYWANRTPTKAKKVAHENEQPPASPVSPTSHPNGTPAEVVDDESGAQDSVVSLLETTDTNEPKKRVLKTPAKYKK